MATYTPNFLKRFDEAFDIIKNDYRTHDVDRSVIQPVMLDTITLLYKDYEDWLLRTPNRERMSFTSWIFSNR